MLRAGEKSEVFRARKSGKSVVYWLLYANRPGHGLPQSAMEREDVLVESVG